MDYLKGWIVFQRLTMNLSENRKDDINELDLITKRHISKVGDNDAYALRALSERYSFFLKIVKNQETTWIKPLNWEEL